jgi:hypothetical protein
MYYWRNDMLTLFQKESGLVAAFVAAAILLAPTESKADAYIGVGIGQAGIEIEDASFPGTTFDEDDFGWKAFLGYEFGLPLLSLGIEGGYVDLGNPSGDVLLSQVEFDADGLAAFGTLGFDIGPLGVFAKYGVISWDASLTIDGVDAGSDDGSDPAYGVGAEIGLWNIDIRAEYEVFDIEDSEDISMVSLGLVWTFD